MKKVMILGLLVCSLALATGCCGFDPCDPLPDPCCADPCGDAPAPAPAPAPAAEPAPADGGGKSCG